VLRRRPNVAPPLGPDVPYATSTSFTRLPSIASEGEAAVLEAQGVLAEQFPVLAG